MNYFNSHKIIRGIRLVILLKVHGKIKLNLLFWAIFSSKVRARILDTFHELGIVEAKKYYSLDSRSEKYPFLETFIFGTYSYCDYNNKTVIDIGAQTGDSILFFAKEGAKRIVAFEPLKENYQVLLNNVMMNKINCITYNEGLGKLEGFVNVYVKGKMAKPISFGEISTTLYKMKVMKLDDYQIQADVVKIDTEGFEIDVMTGGLNTLSNANTVIVETHSKFLRNGVKNILQGLGFRMTRKIINYSGRNVRIEYWQKKS